MTVAHVAARPTGSIPTCAFLGLPLSTLNELRLDDRQALWSGCLDATDWLPTGSHANLIIERASPLVFADFKLRPLFGSWL